MTDALLLAALACFAGGACHSATGFGFSLVAAPLTVAALPPERAVAALLVLGVVASAMTLATERRMPDPAWGESARLLAWGGAGALAGSFLLGLLGRTTLQLLVSVTVLATLAARRATLSRPDPLRSRRWLPVAGVAAGALTTTTTANGPPVLLYLLSRQLSPSRMRDTLSVVFVCFGALGLIAIAVSETPLALPRTAVMAVLAGAVALGHLAGRPLFARLAVDRYEQVVGALLVASVAAGGAVAIF